MMVHQPPPPRGLLSAPVEIIVRILQCCHSSRDLVALASTCRHVYLAWRGNMAAALWPLWLLEIPHFEDAIMAVRTFPRGGGVLLHASAMNRSLTRHDRPA